MRYVVLVDTDDYVLQFIDIDNECIVPLFNELLYINKLTSSSTQYVFSYLVNPKTSLPIDFDNDNTNFKRIDLFRAYDINELFIRLELEGFIIETNEKATSLKDLLSHAKPHAITSKDKMIQKLAHENECLRKENEKLKHQIGDIAISSETLINNIKSLKIP